MKDDNIRNALIALSALVPVVGGTISYILDKYVPSEIERRKMDFLQQLANDIENIKEKIDIKNLETPEFQSIFAKLLQAAIVEHRKEKLTAFRNISLNLLMNPIQANFNKVEFYARLILILIPDEIKVLYTFYLLDVKGELTNYDKKSEPRNIHYIIERLWNNLDREYLNAMLVDCSRYMLLKSRDKESAGNMRAGTFLSDLGCEFVNYIFNPNEVNLYE